MILDQKIKDELIAKAIHMRDVAYCPYSNYNVGAALLADDGRIFTGCNIENSSYGACNCGERTAVFKAVSEGVKKINAIAISGGKRGCKDEGNDLDFAFPCGICRQVLREFSNPLEMKVIVCKLNKEYQEYTLEQLLPHSFGPDNLLSKP